MKTLPKWVQDLAEAAWNESESIGMGFEDGVRAVLERLEATKANDHKAYENNCHVHPYDVLYYGRASVREEILGDE